MEIFPKNPTRNCRYPTERTRTLCNTHWNVTDKGGNTSKVQMKRYLNCHTYTHLVYVSSKLSAPVPTFAFPRGSSHIPYFYRRANQRFSPCGTRISAINSTYIFHERIHNNFAILPFNQLIIEKYYREIKY